MKLPVFTRVVLGLDEYLIELDKADLEKLSVIPSVKSAMKTLYTLRGSKFDLGAIFIDSLPWAEGEEIFFDEEL
ncbi:hypothetical protein GNF10_12215 [Nostoc sp. UCD121]|uniref:hypothetical protein n=1 Tax=unclassified Nostoc TaxID=2593658 RepID=UPI0016231F83|nr:MULTISPECIES: hypothetical protein [unclassified Nostoc]MBC1224150.1 hypothetical protein [Nostoc sp. UCD120]MBC1276728.1 hypothetical protein [Nostoc sp. UCD121]MBC1296576.1 hypothetical protein [Nostoc sp. UCD122]